MKKLFKFVLAVATVATLSSCGGNGSSNSVIGQWAHDTYIYDFTDATNGKYIIDENTTMEFTYEAKNDTLSILYKDNTEPMKLAYKIQGNDLIVTDSFGSEVVYAKK